MAERKRKRITFRLFLEDQRAAPLKNRHPTGKTAGMTRSSLIFPALALALVAAFGFALPGGFAEMTPLAVGMAVVLVVVLLGAIFAAVRHADAIADRLGEPYGTIVLTLAVTVIEVALLASMMTSGGGNPALIRDTVFAVVMIVVNGLVGLCLVAGGLRHHEPEIQTPGARTYLAVLAPLAVFTLVMPNYTLTTPGPYYSALQLGFVSAVTLLLYAAFLFVQTVRHVDYFQAPGDDPHAAEYGPAAPFLASAVLLAISLVGVILLSKKFAALLDVALGRAGAPPALAGIIVALLVLSPESISALKAARQNVMQKSVNLALGSALATIGLTIPTVAIISLATGAEVVLGLGAREVTLLALTLFVSAVTFAAERTNILFGLVHLVIFACYLLLVFAP